MTQKRRPAAPDKLGDRARRFWRTMVTDYDLNTIELRLLEDACREIDLIGKLEDDVALVNSVIPGSMGQDVAHPLFAELRQHRTALAGLLKGIKLPEDPANPAAGGDGASSAGRDLAARRWGRAG